MLKIVYNTKNNIKQIIVAVFFPHDVILHSFGTSICLNYFVTDKYENII